MRALSKIRAMFVLVCLLWILPAATDAAVLNVSQGDEASLRTTISGAAAGDVVNVPSGTYTLATVTCTISKGIVIQGGTGGTSGPTIIRVLSHAWPVFTIDNSGGTISGLVMNDLIIQGFGDGTTGGTVTPAGIKFAGSSGSKLATATFNRLTVSGCIDGISLVAFNFGNSAGVHGAINSCTVTTNSRWGINLENMAQFSIVGTEVNASGSQGIRALSCVVLALRDCASEGNNTSNGTSLEGNAQTLIKLSHGFTVSGYYVENMPTIAGAAKCGLAISNCNSGTIGGVSISDITLRPGSYGIRVMLGSNNVKVTSYTSPNIGFPTSADDTSSFIL